MKKKTIKELVFENRKFLLALAKIPMGPWQLAGKLLAKTKRKFSKDAVARRLLIFMENENVGAVGRKRIKRDAVEQRRLEMAAKSKHLAPPDREVLGRFSIQQASWTRDPVEKLKLREQAFREFRKGIESLVSGNQLHAAARLIRVAMRFETRHANAISRRRVDSVDSGRITGSVKWKSVGRRFFRKVDLKDFSKLSTADKKLFWSVEVETFRERSQWNRSNWEHGTERDEHGNVIGAYFQAVTIPYRVRKMMANNYHFDTISQPVRGVKQMDPRTWWKRLKKSRPGFKGESIDGGQ